MFFAPLGFSVTPGTFGEWGDLEAAAVLADEKQGSELPF